MLVLSAACASSKRALSLILTVIVWIAIDGLL